MLSVFRRRSFAIVVLAVATGLLAAPWTASAATYSMNQGPSGSAVIRPISTFEYGTSVTRGGVTHGSLTIVSTFNLPGARNRAGAIPQNSQRSCVDDVAYTFQSCLTQNYNSCSHNNLEYVDVLNYVERWTRVDPSGDYQLSAPAGVRAGGYGNTDTSACGGKGGVYTDSTEKTISHPAPYTNYTLTPSWTGAYINTSSGRGFYQCGNAYVQIYWVIHPTRTWTFLQPNVCKGTP